MNKRNHSFFLVFLEKGLKGPFSAPWPGGRQGVGLSPPRAAAGSEAM